MFDKIKERINVEWNTYTLQMIGILPLLAAIISTYFTTNIAVILFLFILCLLFDFLIMYIAWLDDKKVVTITRWIRKLCPGWADKLIMLALIVTTWAFVGPLYAMFELRGMIEGHLKWEK